MKAWVGTWSLLAISCWTTAAMAQTPPSPTPPNPGGTSPANAPGAAPTSGALPTAPVASPTAPAQSTPQASTNVTPQPAPPAPAGSTMPTASYPQGAAPTTPSPLPLGAAGGPSPQPMEMQGEVRKPSRKIGLMIAGLATLGGSWGISASVGIQVETARRQRDGGCTGNSCNSFDTPLLIPIAGPWMALSKSESDFESGAMIFLGLAQATGVVLSVIGIQQFVSSGQPATKSTAALQFVNIAPLKGGAQAAIGFSL